MNRNKVESRGMPPEGGGGTVYLIPIAWPGAGVMQATGENR